MKKYMRKIGLIFHENVFAYAHVIVINMKNFTVLSLYLHVKEK